MDIVRSSCKPQMYSEGLEKCSTLWLVNSLRANSLMLENVL